jgi:protein Mpv17
MQTIFIESLFDKSLHIYDSWLVSSPMITKCATSATGFLIGDSIAQIMDKKSDKKYDFYRSIIMTSFGALVHAPSCHYVFNLLEETFPGKKVETILTKILVDQVRYLVSNNYHELYYSLI